MAKPSETPFIVKGYQITDGIDYSSEDFHDKAGPGCAQCPVFKHHASRKS